ncbi:MAG: response regulator [Magnetococcales bacterium]|nr:response regulator [Magnetococcales bacterium]
MARILVIDDDVGVRELLRAFLDEAGHQVVEAPDGRQGVQLFRDEPADLVITDILMPEKDGVEVIMELKERYPEVRILAVSGGGRGLEAEVNLRVAKEFGAMHVLPKPFTQQELQEAVTALLGA